MSEFQYLEFYAVDKPLSQKDRGVISSWSSRAEVSQRRAVFTYSYSDFPRDEKKVFLKYFDAFFYIANWGTIRLMFKLPKDLVNLTAMKRYEFIMDDGFDSGVRIYTHRNHFIVDIHFSEEGGDGWLDENQSWLAEMLDIRNQLLRGDYRSLFLLWLLNIQLNHHFKILETDFQFSNQLIPSGLNQLNLALEAFARLFGVDMNWVDAAATFSSPLSTSDKIGPVQLAKLSTATKDDYLLRLLRGENNLALDLKMELENLKELIKPKVNKKEQLISLEEFLKLVSTEIKRKKNKQQAKKRRAYLSRMKKLAKEEDQIKRSILDNIAQGKGNSYSRALQEILDLRDLYEYRDEKKAFSKYIKSIVKKCTGKPAMIRRLENDGLIP